MNDQELSEYLAREVGQVLVETAKLNRHKLTPREIGDAGDRAGHEFAVHELSKFRPLDHILSEEGEDNLGRLAAQRVWIIDPLDGTSHYSNLEADYAVHVALWERDSAAAMKLSAAAVSIPAHHEVIGLKPEKLENENPEQIRILVSATRPPDELDQICQTLTAEFPELGEPKLIAMGSVGAKLAHIIDGHADLYINTGGFYEWDIAAPAAVARAHGLMACDVYGNTLSFNNADTFVPNAVIGRSQFVQAVIKSLA